MKRFLLIGGALAALAMAVPGVAQAKPAKRPFVSMHHAKSVAQKTMRSYVDYRYELEDGTYFDDYGYDPISCKRARRNIVDCKINLDLYESDEEDAESFVYGENCRWTLRIRRTKHGESVYQLGLPGGVYGDLGSVGCTEI